MGTSGDKDQGYEQEAQCEDPKQEALHLKNLAETRYGSSDLNSALKYAKHAYSLYPDLDGLSEMVTSFKILRVAAKSPGDHYKILQVEPFSNINVIKKHYRKLALTLHPDKNPYLGSEEAFKLVGESFQFLSDKIRRKEYDMKLRIKMQDELVSNAGIDDVSNGAAAEIFWTACSKCNLLHKFEKKYMGHDLLCPNCKKSFKAVEVDANESACTDSRAGEDTNRSENSGSSNRAEGIDLKEKTGNDDQLGDPQLKGNVDGDKCRPVSGEWGGARLRKRTGSVLDILESPKKVRKAKDGEELMTLAEMKLKMKRKITQEKAKVNLKLNEQEKEKENEVEKEKDKNKGECEEDKEERQSAIKKSKILEIEKQMPLKKRSFDIEKHHNSNKTTNFQVYQRRKNMNTSSNHTENINSNHGDKINSNHRDKINSNHKDLEIMVVEDSQFYDFDKDRTERSFKKGQVWAIYDDKDGMPRHYGVIDEVSVHPFQVKMSWLDFENNGDEMLISWEKMGYQISCGRFKVGKSISIDLVNIFSHVSDCERAATKIFRIYPKKGSVWALYKKSISDSEGRNFQFRSKQCYDVVVVLTTYNELHGLSMAYLEKVDGFKAVFKRREIGCHAITWLEKADFRLFSHQVPAKKLSGKEVPEQFRDCWELDPASLSSDLLTVT